MTITKYNDISLFLERHGASATTVKNITDIAVEPFELFTTIGLKDGRKVKKAVIVMPNLTQDFVICEVK
jgi:hypothetical protein